MVDSSPLLFFFYRNFMIWKLSAFYRHRLSEYRRLPSSLPREPRCCPCPLHWVSYRPRIPRHLRSRFPRIRAGKPASSPPQRTKTTIPLLPRQPAPHGAGALYIFVIYRICDSRYSIEAFPSSARNAGSSSNGLLAGVLSISPARTFSHSWAMSVMVSSVSGL